jgi:multidrug efflux pump
VLVIISRSPGANIISTVDRVMAALPDLKASIPADIDLKVALDRTTTIRASLKDVEITLCLSIFLVIAVVFVFLRNPRGSLVPMVAVPVSLLGTFGIMYLLNYSLDNLSLMALTIATGFVVDDAIVVMENIARHVEDGMQPFRAAILGAREVGFTVLSMSVSLIAVFVPLLAMGGIVGRLFREFAVTLSIAVLVSLVISLITTPMMCARLVRPESHEQKTWALFRWSERSFAWLLAHYERSLAWALDHGGVILLILFGTIALNIYLFIIIPKGFFPQQDSGGIIGSIQADQSISFQLMRQKLVSFVNIVKSEPEVSTVVGFTGAGANGTNTGFMYISLKPLDQRSLNGDQVIAKLRGKMAKVPGATAYLQTTQDLRIGGRQSQAQYQYTLQADNLEDLRAWAPKLTEALKHNPNLVDVNSDQQDAGLETDLVVDRATASRLGLTASEIDQTLYDAFGQREVSVIYNPLNQYHVVMEVAPQYWQSPETLHDLYVSTSGGTVGGTQSTGAVSTSAETMVPLDAFSHFGPGTTPLSVNHQGLFTAATISFNLPDGKSLGDATAAIGKTMNDLGVPSTIHGSFQGTAKAFQQSLANEPILIAAALATIYIVLGILYESYIHPITILSTLPSAGVGAVLALKLFGIEFSLIAMIGVFLLIGIVKKNAIMMIDFALAAERGRNLSSRDAIYEACRLRFRPIMMTTFAALFGALPLAIGFGTGAELRRPLGISVVGGLILSQMLTLYTTPVVYLYFDRMRLAFARRSHGQEAHA